MARAAPTHPHARRADIIAVTERLIVEQGGNVSTRAIAEAAGIAEGTIFRVFPTKEAIIDAILEEAYDRELYIAELASIDPNAELTVRMVQLVAVIQRRVRRLMGLFNALGFRRPPSMEAPGKMFRHDQTAREIAALLEPDRDRLRLAPADAARVLWAMVMAQSSPLLGDGPESPEAIVDLVLNGIARHPAPPPASRDKSC